MLFKSVFTYVALLVSSTLAEEATAKKEEAKSVLSADATVADLAKVECKKLTADLLNKLKDPKTCEALTSTCLADFDATSVNGKCLSHVKEAEWKKFDEKTLLQIASGDVATLQVTPAQFKLITDKISLEKIPASFTSYCLRQDDLVEAIFKTENANVFATFFTADNICPLSAVIFRRFGAKFIASLDDNAFSKLHGHQLQMIRAESCAGFSAKQFSAIPAATLNKLTDAQAAKLGNECWNALSDEQVNNFGPKVSNVVALSAAEGAARNRQLLERREFRDHHPCNLLEGKKSSIDAKVAEKLATRCKEVESFNVNNSNGGNLLKASVALIVPLAIAPFLL